MVQGAVGLLPPQRYIREMLDLEEYHAIGYGQEDECKAFELHCERVPAMPRTALRYHIIREQSQAL